MAQSDHFSRRSTFVLVVLAVVVATLLGSVYVLWRLRAETIDRHLEAATASTRTFENHLSHTFNVVELTLSTLAGEKPSTELLDGALRHSPFLRSLAVLDGRGQVIASSSAANLGAAIPLVDFMPSSTEPRPVLRAGRPWIGRDFNDGRPATPKTPAAPDAQTFIPVLRDVAVNHEQWVTLAAAINPDYFLNYYHDNLGALPATVGLYRADGILVLSTDNNRMPGVQIADPALAELVAKDEISTLAHRDENGHERLSAVRGATTFPFAIVVTLDKDRVLERWRGEAMRTIGGALAILLVALTIATVYFVRLERRAKAHDADLARLRQRSAALEAAANAIMITDRKGNVVWANPAFCAMTGYELAEVIDRNPRSFLKSGHQGPSVYHDLWTTILDGRVWRGEIVNRRKDGSLYPEDQTITPVRDDSGAITHFVAVKQDVTERRKNERRLEELSRHLVAAQEEERRRLAGELHDRTSPNLAAIGINLEILAGLPAIDASPDAADRLADVRALIDDTNASVRDICYHLRPAVLDHAGLEPALATLVKQFGRRTGVQAHFEGTSVQGRLSQQIESMCFRIVQEALTNCAKHANALEVQVRLQIDDAVRLEIIDDGLGISPYPQGEEGLGMVTMREMAELTGGQLTIDSAPGKGTRVAVLIPIHKDLA